MAELLQLLEYAQHVLGMLNTLHSQFDPSAHMLVLPSKFFGAARGVHLFLQTPLNSVLGSSCDSTAALIGVC